MRLVGCDQVTTICKENGVVCGARLALLKFL